jgi:hypothetical protein
MTLECYTSATGRPARGLSERQVKVREVSSGNRPLTTMRAVLHSNWVQPVLDELANLAALPPGWDSYGAKSLREESLVATFNLLSQIMVEGIPTPSLVPTRRGTVQIEWHLRNVGLEIEVRSETDLMVSFEDQRNDEVWDDRLSTDLIKLVRAIRAIARR